MKQIIIKSLFSQLVNGLLDKRIDTVLIVLVTFCGVQTILDRENFDYQHLQNLLMFKFYRKSYSNSEKTQDKVKVTHTQILSKILLELGESTR